jgi:hypothetical protein
MSDGGWLIIRTDYQRELSVAREISRHFPFWVPMLSYLHARKLPSAKKATVTLKQRPLMATYVFSAVPMGAVGELHAIDGFASVEYESGSWTPLSIPQIQIDVFRAMIDRENAITENQHRRQTQNKRVKRVVKLGPDALAEVMQELFGIGEQEREAA